MEVDLCLRRFGDRCLIGKSDDYEALSMKSGLLESGELQGIFNRNL